jgi:hypothetical protein
MGDLANLSRWPRPSRIRSQFPCTNTERAQAGQIRAPACRIEAWGHAVRAGGPWEWRVPPAAAPLVPCP